MKSLVQQKFGEAAADYAASPTHAIGPSLARLTELIEPAPTWRHLDIATGAGHTAFVFADKVAKVTASDITKEMLQQVRKLAKERGLGNVVTRQTSADDLPFPNTSYHLVTCRLAAHHFRNPRAFVTEAARAFSFPASPSRWSTICRTAMTCWRRPTTPSKSCATPATAGASASPNGPR